MTTKKRITHRKVGQFSVIVIGIGIIIILLLFVNLFTTEQVKKMNYWKYLQMKPQIVMVDVKTKGSCFKQIENPEYKAYYSTYLGNTWITDNMNSGLLPTRKPTPSIIPTPPPKTIVRRYLSEEKTAVNYWFQVLGIKLFIIKTEAFKDNSCDSFIPSN